MVATTAIPAHKISDSDEPKVRGHEAWKRKKIVKGQEQAKDRASLIPAENVWRELGLED
jgi:hypothetical protein